MCRHGEHEKELPILILNEMLLSVIREYRPRENVTFLENGTKIFATNPKSFVFLRNMSSGDPEVDRVITVNIPFIVRRVLFCIANESFKFSLPIAFVNLIIFDPNAKSSL